VRTIEDGFYVKTNAAGATDYQTKYRDHYWEKLELALTTYWKNHQTSINNTNQHVNRFMDCWKGLTAAWDVHKTTATP
jgi:hypothetical protein